MSLPAVTALSSAPPSLWIAFGQRLASLGLTPAALEPLLAPAQAIDPAIRRPIRSFHLRRRRDPAGAAVRMLLFSDPVNEDEARAALGPLVDPLIEAGILARGAAGIVSPFILGIVDDLYILSDDLSRGGEAVMGLGESTVAICRAAFPGRDRPVDQALDLGCGAGTAALFLARCARRVVGTDINPRAIAIARVNAAINGVNNVDFREGDLWAPVAGEAFDLIVSQPPFVPAPDGSETATFLHGGRRGDELAQRLLAGIAPHLTSKGRALVMVEWPDDGSDGPAARARAAVGGDGLHVLAIEGPLTSPDAYAAAYAAAAHPILDRAFEDQAIRLREHLDRMKIRGLRLTLNVFEPARGAPAWTDSVTVGPVAKIGITSARIGKIFAAREVAADRDRLLAARLRVPEGTVLAQEQVGPGADVPSTIEARFPASSLVASIGLTVDLLGLVTTIHEATSVRAGIERFAELTEAPIEPAMAALIPAVANALRHGLLEIA